MTFRVGTRRSPLAQAQTDRVLSLLPPGVARKVVVESEGDVDKTSPIHRMERPGAFTAVLTDAILEGRIEAAVHSLKDLPLQAPAEAPIVAILARDDPADVLIVRDDARDTARPLGLRAGSRVGSSAPRRQTQVLDADPDLVPLDVRGNVGTRLNLLAAGVVDGLLMAAAAFERMTLPLPPGASRVRLDPATFPPGPGQGTIAVQARAGTDAARLLATLDHAPTRAAVDLERGVLAGLGGGCGMPVGAYARPTPGNGWRLAATLAADGWEGAARVRLTRAEVEAGTPEAALRECLSRLAAPLPPPARPEGKRHVLLTLPADACEAYAPTLAEKGWRVVPWELIAVQPTQAPPPPGADRAGWLAVASPRAAPHAAAHADALRGPLPRVAALGPATARALRRHGLPVHVLAPEGTGAGLADAIAAFPAEPAPVLVPQATRPIAGLRAGLEARGFEVLPWPVYETHPLPFAPLPADAEAIVLTSPSNVEAFAARGPAPAGVRLVAFGPSTETAMRRAGLPVHAVAPRRSASGLAEVLP